jgi:hypothetical protein
MGPPFDSVQLPYKWFNYGLWYIYIYIPVLLIAKLVNITPITMVYDTQITIVNGVYKLTYSWGAPSCRVYPIFSPRSPWPEMVSASLPASVGGATLAHGLLVRGKRPGPCPVYSLVNKYSQSPDKPVSITIYQPTDSGMFSGSNSGIYMGM